MKPALATLAIVCLAACIAAPLVAQPAQPADAPSPDLRAAQLNVKLANLQLALAQAKERIKIGQFAGARQDLARSQDLMAAIDGQTDLTAYHQVADKLAKDLEKAQDTQRRLNIVKQYGQAPIPPEAFNRPDAANSAQEGYGNPNTTEPRQPNLDGQAALAAGQAAQAEHTNVADSPAQMTTDPVVLKQRALDHQTLASADCGCDLWNEGRYAPAKELIDVGKLVELDRERMYYHAAVEKIADGSHGDQLQHVREALIAPPAVMNYPADWAQIKEARKEYAGGKLVESAPVKDADGKTRTFVVYDISDLLFVPIFPGPSEYNVNRPVNPVQYWTNQDRLRDIYTHPPFTVYAPGFGYNGPTYGPGGGAVFGPPAGVGPAGGAPAAQPGRPDGNPVPANPVQSNAMAAQAGGYSAPFGGAPGNQVTDIIPSASYYPFEADPIYQYRLAMKRAQVLNAVSALLSSIKD